MNAWFLADYAKTYAFFLGTSTDETSQMTVLPEQTDWPCAISTAEVQELQPSETFPVVAKKQSKYWNYIEGISTAYDRTFLDFMQLETFTLNSVSPCHLKSSLTCWNKEELWKKTFTCWQVSDMHIWIQHTFGNCIMCHSPWIILHTFHSRQLSKAVSQNSKGRIQYTFSVVSIRWF